MILGSGLSAIESSVNSVRSLLFEEISGLRTPSVEGHPGRMLLVREGRSHILLFAGRIHLYEQPENPERDRDASGSEGGSGHTCTAAVRLAARLGCKRLLLTQAAGSLRRDLEIGSWMLAEDIVSLPHIRMKEAVHCGRPVGGSVSGVQPGKLITDEFRRIVAGAAIKAGIEIFNGTLFWTTGPCYETAAEARMARYMGADAATMSPLPELLEARRSGLAVSCLSRISNLAPNISSETVINHGNIVDTGLAAAADLLAVIRGLS
ncbi:MAG: hypothetical protein JW746_06530 [Candidatus Krumholzibacteriota bacterium]|nr:hypothetical protein [Candidatus Krumholzibacteriota bacterium]